MDVFLLRAIHGIWIALPIFWVFSAAAVKQSVRREASAARVAQVAILVLAFLLLFDPQPFAGIHFLFDRFLPQTTATLAAGAVITLAGAAFAVWARLRIGGNWSSSITIKKDHELVRSGPYALVRHPIYSGLLLAFAGTAIAFAELRGLIGLALSIAGWRAKSVIEERFMQEQFGDEYARYKRQVKALIPYLL